MKQWFKQKGPTIGVIALIIALITVTIIGRYKIIQIGVEDEKIRRQETLLMCSMCPVEEQALCVIDMWGVEYIKKHCVEGEDK